MTHLRSRPYLAPTLLAVLPVALGLGACTKSSDPVPPSPLPGGTTSAKLVAALDQIAPYVVDHELLTSTGTTDLGLDGRGATDQAAGGGILLSTGLATDSGLGSYDFSADGLADSTAFRIVLDVPAGSQTLVMSAQYVTSELTTAGVRADDVAYVEYGAPGAAPTQDVMAQSSGSFSTTSVTGKHVLDVSGASTVEVRWDVSDADDGAVDSALRLFDVYFSQLPDPGPVPPQDEFRMGDAVDPDNYFADPINLDTGAFVHDESLIHVPGGSIPFSFSLHYDSTAPQDSYPVGARWRHSYQWSVSSTFTEIGERVRVQRGDGGSDYFVEGDAGFEPESEGTYSFLVERPAGGWRYTTKGRITYHFDDNGYLLQVSDRNGNGLSFHYNDSILVSIRDARGQAALLTFGGNGRLAQVEYAGLLEVQLAYEEDRLVEITRPDGATRSFTYDSADRIESVQDGMGTTVAVNIYNSQGRVEQQVDAFDNASEISYVADTTVTTDREGAVQKKTFDSGAGRIVRWENAAEGVWEFTYDSAHELVEELGPFEGTTHFWYDDRGNMTARRDALGAPSRVAYDTDDQMVFGQDPLGHATHFAYDERGNLVARTDPLGNQDQYEYDASGRLLRWTDANGNETLYTYNSAGDVTGIVDPLGHTLAYGYDDLGRRLFQSDPEGHTTHFTYDPAGRLLNTVGPLGREMAYTYDVDGRVVLERAPDGAETKFEYWPTGRLKRRVDALGNALSYEYDAEERLKSVTDPLGRKTEHVYDAAGRLERVLDAEGGAASSEYDVANRRTAVVDPNGNKTSFEHDIVGQVVGQTDALGNKATREFDLAGRLVTRTNARGQLMEFEYDAADRLVRAQLPSGDVTHVYDANGNALITVKDGQAPIQRTVDDLDRLTSRTDSNGWKVAYAYDAVGNLSTLTYPNGDTVNYTYDALGRLVSLVDWAGRATHYQYDVAGDLVQELRADGSTVRYSYDAAGRLTEINDRDATGLTLYRTAFELDGAGNVVRERTALPLERKPAMGITNFSYGPGNQLLDQNGQEFTYDADGNLMFGKLDGAVQRFLNDELGRLVRAGNDRYAYDADGFRIEARVDGKLRSFVVDAAVSPARVLEERNAQGKLVARYVHGLGLVGREAPSGSYKTYHYDSRGSTLALTNQVGVITDRYAYGPFGRLLAQEGTTPNPFRYVGREGVQDDGNGLVFMRARYYAPELMRFLQRDAAYLGALSDTQSLNGYAYVGNNPIVRIDPEGEFWNAVAGAVIGAVVNVAVQATVDAINGEFSGWDNYAGAAVEGAIGGALIGSGAGLTGFLLGAGGQGFAVLAGSATQQLVAGDGLDFSSGELWADVGFAAATGGFGQGMKKGKKFFKANKTNKLQGAGDAKGLGKLLGKDAMDGFKSLYSPLKRGNLGRLMRSPAVRQSIRDQLIFDYAKGIFGERDKIHALQYMN